MSDMHMSHNFYLFNAGKVGARGSASLEGRDSSRLPIWTTSLLAYISLYASVAGVSWILK